MIPASNSDGADLVERARQGDVDAYGELVRRHRDQALAAAYVILGDRHEAEDATQEAFTNAFLALERFRPGASFRAWLLRIVINEARDLRSARLRQTEFLSGAAGRVETAGPQESAETAAFEQTRREALLAALFELPEADRLVVTCRYFLDLSEAETADVLRIARGTVKSRLSRALSRLGPIIRDLGPLVVVPPVVHVQPVAPDLAAAGGLKGVVASAVSKVRARIQQTVTLAGATVAAVTIASVVMVSRGRSAPAAPPSQKVIVYGGDLTDADRQGLAASFATGASVTESVSHEELVDALTAQGMAVQQSDQAISSVSLVCGSNGSVLDVQTRNITRMTASEYAAALITAGLYDGSLIVASPAAKPVSGETALVGALKAYPTCASGSQLAPERVRLAYQELKVVSDIAGANADLSRASTAFLELLNEVLQDKSNGASSVEDVIQSVVNREGLRIDDSTRAEAVALLGGLKSVDFGPFHRGLVVQQIDQDHVRIEPAQ